MIYTGDLNSIGEIPFTHWIEFQPVYVSVIILNRFIPLNKITLQNSVGTARI